jgi:hypothetical protein
MHCSRSPLLRAIANTGRTRAGGSLRRGSHPTHKTLPVFRTALYDDRARRSGATRPAVAPHADGHHSAARTVTQVDDDPRRLHVLRLTVGSDVTSPWVDIAR